MTVKEIIMLACDMIDRDELTAKIEKSESLNEEEEKLKNDLLKCFNFIQNEIATEFCPLIEIEKIKAENKMFEISKLKERLAFVISLKDCFGEKIRHKIIGDKLVFEGEGELEYCYCPKKKGFDDECEVSLPERVVACGLLREYFLLVCNLQCNEL